MEHISAVVMHLVEHAGYLGLFLVMVLGNLAVPVGTEVVVPTAGYLAATGHLSSPWLAAIVATCGELVGGYLLYSIGRYGGPPLVHRFGRYVHIREKELERVHVFFERFGAKTVFISRFIPVVRGVAALPAGLSDMRRRTFLTYHLAGSLIFCFSLVYVGASLGKNFVAIEPLFHKLGLALPIILVLGILAVVLKRRLETTRIKAKARLHEM